MMSEIKHPIDKWMKPVGDAIKRHHAWPSDEFTDIYNRAYEAIVKAIKEVEHQKGVK